MKRSVTVQVTTVAGAEVLADALHGISEATRKVVAIHMEQGADLRLRVYKNQERVIDSAADCNDFDSNAVDCDIDLEPGDLLQVGYQSDGATAAAHYATVDYIE